MSVEEKIMVAGLARRFSLLVMLAAGLAMCFTAYGQATEAMHTAAEASRTLGSMDNQHLLAAVAIGGMLLAAYFGWLERTGVQRVLDSQIRMEKDIQRLLSEQGETTK